MEKVFNIWKNFEDSVIKGYPYFKIPFYLLKTAFKYFLTYLIFIVLSTILIVISYYKILPPFLPHFYLIFCSYIYFSIVPSIIFLLVFSLKKSSIHPIMLSSIFLLFIYLHSFNLNNVLPIAPATLILNLFILLFHLSILDLIKIIKHPNETIPGILKNRNYLLILNILLIIFVSSSSLFLNSFNTNDELVTFKKVINDGSYNYRDYYYLALFQYNNSDFWGARNSLLDAISRNPLCIDSWFFFFGNDFQHASFYKQNYNSSFIIE